MVSPIIENFSIDDTGFLFIIESSHSRGFKMNFHRHDFFELTFILGGRGRYEVLTETGAAADIPVESNQMLLWDGAIPHRAKDEPDAPLQQLILIFDEAYLLNGNVRAELRSQLAKTNPIVIRNPMFTMRLKPLMRNVMIEKRIKKKLYDDVVYASMLTILTTILRAAAGAERISGDSGDARIRKAIAFIQENYFHPPAVQEVASYCALSVRHFTELFKKNTGQSYIQYLHAYRIEKVKLALRETDKSITDIAFEVGYDDPAHFIRRFKMMENMTPTVFRKTRLKNFQTNESPK